ncbi:hypothetical protein N7520_001978 [Penicillium odoratum]|uniref:uncharacterized protein n=1 Tax=Penicillium odoratum TaxID=1167516 RepID=UPI002548DEF4|nr:uncharacterized protein N7520_001978 [Penicillium odoratum]KAJ5778732.1 hypothetical protein N7520_001978 [Penicillium odoratum]
MDDHPEHWRHTLMGWDFWKDAAVYEEQCRDNKLHEERDPNLLKRFPFNLGPEQGPYAKEQEQVQDRNRDKTPVDEPEPAPTPIPQRRRKLSMSDITGVSGLRHHRTVTAATSRLRDLGRRRHPSPTRPTAPPRLFPQWTVDNRLTFRSSLMGKLAQREPTVEETEETEETEESATSSLSVPPFKISASMPSSPRPPTPPVADRASSDAGVFEYDMGIATPERPLLNFRGGHNWSIIPVTRKRLGLDLFRPYDTTAYDDNWLDRAPLEALSKFRGLRSLKITGMMQSYQRSIWQAAWLNRELDELELEMALEPEIVNPILQRRWKDINEKWAMDRRMGGEPVYFGNGGYRGYGEINTNIGFGEYLDKRAIETAKVSALHMGHPSRRLSICKLTLSGFIVDADPIIQWFDPEKLRTIQFKGYCVDAGLWLPLSMRSVSIQVPKKIHLQAVPFGYVKVNLEKDLKALEIRGGKVLESTMDS